MKHDKTRINNFKLKLLDMKQKIHIKHEKITLPQKTYLEMKDKAQKYDSMSSCIDTNVEFTLAKDVNKCTCGGATKEKCERCSPYFAPCVFEKSSKYTIHIDIWNILIKLYPFIADCKELIEIDCNLKDRCLNCTKQKTTKPNNTHKKYQFTGYNPNELTGEQYVN